MQQIQTDFIDFAFVSANVIGRVHYSMTPEQAWRERQPSERKRVDTTVTAVRRCVSPIERYRESLNGVLNSNSFAYLGTAGASS